MTKRDMKSALANSLKAEDTAVRDRFERAESLFNERTAVEPIAAPPPAQEQPLKEEKTKVIRDSFTLPASDYDLINTIRQRCLDSAMNVTKSEVIRAGLHALTEMSETQLAAVMEGLEKVKTGRPSGKF